MIAVQQATLVWSIADAGINELVEFVNRGTIPSGKGDRVNFSAVPGVDQKIAEIVANGGKLIVEPKDGR